MYVPVHADLKVTCSKVCVTTDMQKRTSAVQQRWQNKAGTDPVGEGATSRVVHLEKFSLNFSSSLLVISVNLLHPLSSLLLYGLLLSLWCFSIFVKYYFQASFNLKVILYVAKITQNTVTELLYVSVK